MVAAALLVGTTQVHNIPGLTPEAKAATATEAIWDIPFDDDTTGAWFDSGSSANTVVDSPFADTAVGDGKVLQVADRVNSWDGVQSPTGVLEPGKTYTASMRVRLADGEPGPANIHFVVYDGANYNWVGGGSSVTADGWTTVEGTFTVANSADQSVTKIYTGGENLPGADSYTFYVDDILITTPSDGLEPDLTNTPIKDTVDFPVGIAVSQPQIEGSAGDLTVHHYDQITPENAMKVENWYDSDGNFRIDPVAQETMRFALDNDLRVYGHTLAWFEGQQMPAWFFNVSPTDSTPLTNSAADQQILRDRLRNHVFNVAKTLSDEFGKFGSATNKLVAFDVVNEPIAANDSIDTGGLRNSRWYQVLGADFINLAFQYADQAFNHDYAAAGANRPVKLFINDFDFEVNSGKTERVVNEVNALVAAGVPIDGIGTQQHLAGTNTPSVAAVVASMNQLASIKNSSGDPILVAVTELDSLACQGRGCNATKADLTAQGYYYQQLFDAFRKFSTDNPGQLFSVTMWGLDDGQSWRSKDSNTAPLPFDAKLQVKPAYCGITGDCALDPLQMTANVFGTDSTTGDISATAEGVDSDEWAKLPLVVISGVAGFEARWAPDALSVYVTVDDANPGAGDAVTIKMNGTTCVVTRDGSLSGAGSAAVVERADGSGYAMVVTLPLDNANQGDAVSFDIQVAGASDAPAGWNLGGVMGTLNLLQPLKFVAVPEAATPPVIDGSGDDAAWADAATVTTLIASAQSGMLPGGAEATVKLTWAGDVLYVLAMVTDPEISNAAADAYQHDSVEIYVDRGNTKHGSLDNIGITQMRIGADGADSYGRGGTEAEQKALLLAKSAKLTDTGYIIEAAISLSGMGGAGTYHGFDVQVNDATGAARTAIHNWADPTDNGYQSAAQYGVALLLPLAVEPTPEPPVTEEPEPQIPSGGTVVPPSLAGLAMGGLLLVAGLGVTRVRRWVV